MKKFAMILEGQIIHKYEAEEKLGHGGPPEMAAANHVEYNFDWEEIKLVDGQVVENTELINSYEYQLVLCHEKRKLEYPDFLQYMDGLVKGDQKQMYKYISDCLAVKTKYPLPTKG